MNQNAPAHVSAFTVRPKRFWIKTCCCCKFDQTLMLWKAFIFNMRGFTTFLLYWFRTYSCLCMCFFAFRFVLKSCSVGLKSAAQQSDWRGHWLFLSFVLRNLGVAFAVSYHYLNRAMPIIHLLFLKTSLHCKLTVTHLPPQTCSWHG